jgi:hypothetical protein
MSATNPSVKDALVSLIQSGSAGSPGAALMASNASGDGAASSAARFPSDSVELSDRAQQVFARNRTDQTAADKLDQLVCEIRGQGSKGKTAASSNSAVMSGKSDAATTGDETIDAIKAMARMPEFRAAANGRTDDAVRSLVRDGNVPQLPLYLTDEQAAQVSEKEITLFTIVQGVQGLYNAMEGNTPQLRSMMPRSTSVRWKRRLRPEGDAK